MSNGNGNGNGHALRYNRLTAVPFPEDRLPPQHIEAEQGVLGAILLDNGVLDDVIAILNAEDFWRDDHQIIYRAILGLRHAGIPVDAILLDEELKRLGEFERVGGLDYITDLINRIPHAGNAKYHAQVVKHHAERRRLIATARQVTDDAYGYERTNDELADTISGSLDGLATGRFGNAEEAVASCLADVTPEDVRWLWPGRIPSGMITLLLGDPGLGKSFLTHSLAATISLGAPWPDAPGVRTPVGSTILLSAEDALSFTVRPRLDAAGADCRKVHALTMIRSRSGRKRGFSLQQDIPRLEELANRIGDCRLIVIDPISAYLGAADEHRNAEMRELLTPLKEMAERTDVAVLMVTHMNKGTGTNGLYRATGSIAFGAAARAFWGLCQAPDDKASRELRYIKDNINATRTGLSFRIIDGAIQWETRAIEGTFNEGLQEVAQNANKGARKHGPTPLLTTIAMEWVRKNLANPEKHGALRTAAEAEGIKTTTFYDALERLKVERFKLDKDNYLRLPSEDDEGTSDNAPAF